MRSPQQQPGRARSWKQTMLVLALLCAIFNDRLLMVDAKKKAKTTSPTFTPTLTPTSSAPTKRPTSMPTLSPTKGPTAVPTSRPTSAPTSRPTSRPTSPPTSAPTAMPTSRPTSVPTNRRSSQPTSVPTPKPTEGPTTPPTSQPTPRPTTSPTSRPTTSPTTMPTRAPTSKPSFGPTTAPQEFPTTSYPTRSPTPEPTDLPSSRPTSSPTSQPTSQPSSTPTSQPTTSPTSNPTKAPVTQAPTKPMDTIEPTAAPTKFVPTAGPTSLPTQDPITAAPTKDDSNTTVTTSPTVLPTASPTSSPTVLPTASPTALPTASPTTSPTVSPTALPTVSDQDTSVELPQIIFEMRMAEQDDSGENTLDSLTSEFLEDLLRTNVATSKNFESADLQVTVKKPLTAATGTSSARTTAHRKPHVRDDAQHQILDRRLQESSQNPPTRITVEGLANFAADPDDPSPTPEDIKQMLISYFSFWGRDDLRLHLENNQEKVEGDVINVWIDGTEIESANANSADENDGSDDGRENGDIGDDPDAPSTNNLRSSENNGRTGSNSGTLQTSIIAGVSLLLLVVVLAGGMYVLRNRETNSRSRAFTLAAASSNGLSRDHDSIGSDGADVDGGGAPSTLSGVHASDDDGQDKLRGFHRLLTPSMGSNDEDSNRAMTIVDDPRSSASTPERTSNRRRLTSEEKRHSPTFLDGLQGFEDHHHPPVVDTGDLLTLGDDANTASAASPSPTPEFLDRSYLMETRIPSSASGSSSSYDASRLDKVIAMAREASETSSSNADHDN